jgi:hypothetical protein
MIWENNYTPRTAHMFDVLTTAQTANIEMVMAKTLPLGKNLTFGGNFGFEPKALKPMLEMKEVLGFPILAELWVYAL